MNQKAMSLLFRLPNCNSSGTPCAVFSVLGLRVEGGSKGGSLNLSIYEVCSNFQNGLICLLIPSGSNFMTNNVRHGLQKPIGILMSG